MAIHAKIKAGNTHAVVEQINGIPQMDETGANLIEGDGDTAWFSWDDFTLISNPNDYASEIDHYRVHDEGDGWVVDGANSNGEYTEHLYKADTFEQVVTYLPRLRHELEQDGIKFRNEGANDLPEGYRWATEEETERNEEIIGAIVVKRTADSTGRPYTQDEADIAVPLECVRCGAPLAKHPGYVPCDRTP